MVRQATSTNISLLKLTLKLFFRLQLKYIYTYIYKRNDDLDIHSLC